MKRDVKSKKNFNWFTFFAVYHSLTRKLRRLLHLNCQKKNQLRKDYLASRKFRLRNNMCRRGKCVAGEMCSRVNIRSGKCPVGELSSRGNVWSGKCQVGEVSVGELSSRGWVSWGNVGRGNIQSGKCLDIENTLSKKLLTIFAKKLHRRCSTGF